MIASATNGSAVSIKLRGNRASLRLRNRSMSPPPETPIYAALSESAMFRDYQDAFEKATGLSLNLHEPGDDHGCGAQAQPSGGSVLPFCALLTRSNRSCAACFALQNELEAKAQLKPTTLKCFAGLCETAVPVRVGEKLIAFLQTGRPMPRTASHCPHAITSTIRCASR